MTDGDTALLDELREMWMAADPPPPGLTETMIAVVAAADLDQEWELLTLVSDSADGPAAQVRGQLLDFEGELDSVEVTVDTTDGQTWTTSLDESGFFLIQAEPTGSVRFTVRSGDSVSSSRWIEI